MTEDELLREPTGLDVVCEAIGAIIEFWGFKRVMGRIWALCYLSPRPLSAADICEGLQISTGTASTTLHELREWGVVRRAVVPGSRTAHYEAETNVWKMISKVFREREHDRFLDLATRLRDGAARLREEAGRAPTGDPEADLRQAQAARSEHLALLAEQAAAVLEAFLDAPDLDIAPLIQALRQPV